jgi:hypothetical protein
MAKPSVPQAVRPLAGREPSKLLRELAVRFQLAVWSTARPAPNRAPQ